MSPIFFFLLQFIVLAYAFVGGVFLAFSDFIMRSLALASGTGGAEAMQVINREVFRWFFMGLFIGLAPLSLLVSGHGYYLDNAPGMLMMAAGLTYLIGCFGVTVFFNVPMNEALAGMDLSAQTARVYWADTYVPRWTFWNSVRTIACAISAALLLVGLLWIVQSQSHSG